MKLKCILSSLCLMLSLSLMAQIKIGDNPTSIDNGSLLELESTSKALVLPRMTTAQMNAISSPLDGAMIYNIDKACVYEYKTLNGSSQWVSTCQGNEILVVELANDATITLNANGHKESWDGIVTTNTISGASYNTANDMCTFPPGTYIMTLVYEAKIPNAGANPDPTISSYFYDFPSNIPPSYTVRLHNNQPHFGGVKSPHGGMMQKVVTLTSTTNHGVHIGRGSGGNYGGDVTFSANGRTYFSARRIKE